ncbi:sigma-54-dependent transcriptional regulator [Thermocrinis minervae]|uniref:Two-component system, NtrC family, response regulator/two-component system, NtrC family, response regulator AtoC n=1 Tax=Thermocrinis minervae TaxID=381751 RepID=A0A1M6Q214_9AQUI|nr:sigma-54 dependent transcriptional regulator [Thermocrinis minervae]SHK14249.1 two-component system, NtrC family, response regulator/two-component system, NtrC family, response regulator AtoC [Thermocrinis minervae]
MVRVLVVEDDTDFGSLLLEYLSNYYTVDWVKTLKDAVDRLSTNSYDVAIVDVLLPDGNGVDILETVKSNQLGTEVVFLTGHGSIKLAVEAMKKGANDFLTKPCSLDDINMTVEKALETLRTKKENKLYKLEKALLEEEYVFKSPKMKEVLHNISKISCSDCPVLLVGETGVGKEVIARLIHQLSPRKAKPMVVLNLASIPKDLVEAELFGYEKGAFTGAVQSREGFFELANEGTIFLDEVTDIPVEVQAKLLRVVEHKSFFRIGGKREIHTDVRLIAATNADVKKLIEEGKFRKDLYYRLSTVEIYIPPLRERPEDIIPLAEHFLRFYSHKYRKSIEGFTRQAKEELLSYTYPGNVRELKSIVERAVLFAEGRYITPQELCIPNTCQGTLTLKDMERQRILEALKLSGNNKKKAAQMLGIPLRTLYRKLRYHNLL